MPIPEFRMLLTVAALLGASPDVVADPVASWPTAVLRVTSGTPGHEVRFRGVLLVLGQPMRVIEQATPFQFQAEGALVLGAFEPQEQGPLLRLELISNFPVPAAVTAPRVMAGQRVGGVATEFVQGY
jgi:hypothetical protein